MLDVNVIFLAIVISGVILSTSCMICRCIKGININKENNTKIPINVVDHINQPKNVKREVVLSRPNIIKWLSDNKVNYNVSDSDKMLMELYNKRSTDTKCVRVVPADEPKIDPDRLND